MKRIISWSLVLTLAVFASTALVGCGDDSERTRIPKSRLKPTKSFEDLSPEEQAAKQQEREEMIAAVMEWPDDAGEKPDVHADYRSCQAEMRSKRPVARANPLVQMTWLGRCMAQKGWVMDPNADLPQG